MNAPVDPNLSGIMHCWLAATAEVGGQAYVCVRGVNFLDEYRSGIRISEKGNRMHQAERPAWLHVPSVTFAYDPADLDGTASPLAAEKQIAQKIDQLWPGLAAAKMSIVDQNFTSSWGGTTSEGKTEAVTRVFLDFGKVERLPEVLLLPDSRPGFPRHPVLWVKATDIAMAADEMGRFKNGGDASRYKLVGSYATPMEMDKTGTLEEKLVTDHLVQETVGDIYRKVKGKTFFAALGR